MARNVYFSQAVKSEQNMYEDLVIEALRIYGQDVYYLPRNIISRNNILGEDRASNFNDAYMIEAYIENAEGFEGSGDLYSKFGLEIRDDATFIISKRQWEKYIGFYETGNQTAPREGDLIFLPMTNKFFEISFIEHEQPFYQLNNLPVYKMQCQLFEYNDEDFETGVDLIDDVQETVSYITSINYTLSTANVHPEVGETITQILSTSPAINVFGEIQTLDIISPTSGRIGVSNIGVSGVAAMREFEASSTLTASCARSGGQSAITVTITKVFDIGDNSTFYDPTEGDAGASAFEVGADGFMDFTEINPFGDPSDSY
jgi:hypothetical protein